MSATSDLSRDAPPFVPAWPVRHTVPPLAEAVHVWCVRLSRPSAEVKALAALLAADEAARAQKFRFARDREHYIVARGVLRTLIGRYERMAPAAVSFQYGGQGKPAVTGDLCFNLSHAAGMALIAFARGREIGVDVEPVRRLPDADRVARRFFSAAEYETWTAVPWVQQPAAFFNCWTRKEAFIKAIGEGLSCPLASFGVSLRSDEPARLLHIRGSEAEAARWRLHTLAPAPGYVGAVIAEAGEWPLACFSWPD